MQQPYNTDPREQPGYASAPTSMAAPDPNSAFGPTSAYMQPAPVNGAPVPYPVPYAVPVPVPAQGEPGRGQALTSLILGVVSVASIPMMLSFLALCGAPIAVSFSALGLIFGALGLRSTSRKGMAITGIVLSAGSLGLAILFAILMFWGVGPFGY